jgi:hypothetical protein
VVVLNIIYQFSELESQSTEKLNNVIVYCFAKILYKSKKLMLFFFRCNKSKIVYHRDQTYFPRRSLEKLVLSRGTSILLLREIGLVSVNQNYMSLKISQYADQLNRSHSMDRNTSLNYTKFKASTKIYNWRWWNLFPFIGCLFHANVGVMWFCSIFRYTLLTMTWFICLRIDKTVHPMEILHTPTQMGHSLFYWIHPAVVINLNY